MILGKQRLSTSNFIGYKHPHLVVKGMTKGKSSKHRRFTYDTDDDLLFGQSPSMSGSFTTFAIQHPPSHDDPIIKPRNAKQKEYIRMLEEPNPAIVIATGAAGTGKTMIACTVAIKKLLENDIRKLVLTRPMVNVDDDVGIGFLPGSLEEKCQPWLSPLTDVFYNYITPQKFQSLLSKQVIEICPLEIMRGRSFEDTIVIVDEAQNCSTTQMLMLLTRIGRGSKIIITGDPMQHDRIKKENGLKDFLNRIAKSRDTNPELVTGIGSVHFTDDCIERHPIIKNILKLYEVGY